VSETRTGSPIDASTPVRIAAPFPRFSGWRRISTGRPAAAAARRASSPVPSEEPSSTTITSHSQPPGRARRHDEISAIARSIRPRSSKAGTTSDAFPPESTGINGQTPKRCAIG